MRMSDQPVKKPVKIAIRKLDRVETTRPTVPGDG